MTIPLPAALTIPSDEVIGILIAMHPSDVLFKVVQPWPDPALRLTRLTILRRALAFIVTQPDPVHTLLVPQEVTWSQKPILASATGSIAMEHPVDATFRDTVRPSRLDVGVPRVLC